MKVGRLGHSGSPICNNDARTVGFWEGLKRAFTWKAEASSGGSPSALVGMQHEVVELASERTLRQPVIASPWAQEDEMNHRLFEELHVLQSAADSSKR